MRRIVKLFHKGGYVLHFFTQGTENLFQNFVTCISCPIFKHAMKSTPILLLLLFSASLSTVFGQVQLCHPYCTLAEEGHDACRDTIAFFKRRETYDIGVILPSWPPIVSKNYLAVLEGRVTNNYSEGTEGPHMSYEDLPFYHYSHDFNFDVLPDSADDNRYVNMLPYLVYPGQKNKADTVLQTHIHIEWESGIGMCNPINPLKADNDAGRSGGFYTAGHERTDVIWNFPTINDWVHVEGNYVWDRGHPPAQAEIHPPRFVAIRRELPEQLIIGDSSAKFAMRVDLFASGDGGALVNNRYNAPAFVQRVNMSSKDYEVTVHVNLSRPSPNAVLRYELLRRKPDNFSQYELIETNDNEGTVHITIPWKTTNANDLEIYARTLYVFWDEGRGTAANTPVDLYKVRFTNLNIKKLSDYFSKAEIRLFANVGNDWIFLNDFFPKKGKILTRGLGKTRKKKWDLNNEFTVAVPRGKVFRVYMAGWEVDGVDLLSGDLMDPGSPCNRKTKRFIKDRAFSLRNMVMKGCMDDQYGDISEVHSYSNLGKLNVFTNSPKSGKNDDPCPFSEYPLKGRYFLSYTIEKLN